MKNSKWIAPTLALVCLTSCNFLFASILEEAPVAWGQLGVQPFALMRGLNATLRQELYPISEICECKLYTFIAGNYAPEQRAPYINGRIRGSHAWNAAFGIAYKFFSFWTLGLAGSYNWNTFERRFKQGRSHTDFRSLGLSVLSSMEFCHGYFNGIGNVGWLRYDKIRRHFQTGPQKWVAKGKTNGMQYDFLFEGGWYFLDFCHFRFGPIATIEYQWDHVDGYSEHFASYNNLQYKRQDVDSFVTGIGLETVIFTSCEDCPPGFSVKVFIAANEDWVNHNRHVKFRQLRFVGAPFEKRRINQKRTFFGSGGINLTKTFCNGAILSVGYRGYLGQHHMAEHNVSVSALCPF